MMCYNTLAVRKYACFRRFGPVAQLGERTVRIREVRGFDPLQVHHKRVVRTTEGQEVIIFLTREGFVLLSPLNVCG